jgi:hypothetical protein
MVQIDSPFDPRSGREIRIASRVITLQDRNTRRRVLYIGLINGAGEERIEKAGTPLKA